MLPFVITISLVMVSICGAMVLALYYHNLVVIKYQTESHLLQNIQSSTEIVLASSTNDFPCEELVIFDLFNEGKDSISILRKRWGVLNLFVTEAFSGNFRKSKVFVIGNSLPQFPGTALFLSDKGDVGLFLVGSANIVGDAYVPRLGVFPGYLNSQSFLGKELINGGIEESLSTMPQINPEVLVIFELLSGNNHHDSLFSVAQLDNVLMKHSFTEATLYCYSEEPVHLRGDYSGNICIVSGSKITVSSSSKLEDVILLAPEIEVESDFVGSVQLFAQKSIVVGDNVRLLYPSVVACENSNESSISIGNGCLIEGGVCMVGSNSKGSVYIGKSLVYGLVVSYGNVELLGKIIGQLICERLIFRGQYDKVYFNYLVNGEINIQKVPAFFLYPDIFLNYDGSCGILKFLN
jgi:hypothetical protein